MLKVPRVFHKEQNVIVWLICTGKKWFRKISKITNNNINTFSSVKIKKKKKKKKIPASKGKEDVWINAITNPETNVYFKYFPLPLFSLSKFKQQYLSYPRENNSVLVKIATVIMSKYYTQGLVLSALCTFV